MTENTSNDPFQIVVCLSGGGFRATFFHLGVFAALRDAGALDYVTKIYSVSGGSITASYLVSNWAALRGPIEDFVQVGKRLVEFGRSGIRNRMLRRWILSFVPLGLPRYFIGGPGQFLEREYANLLGKDSFYDIYNAEVGCIPDLEILATSFTTGELCAFTKNGFVRESAAGYKLHKTGLVPLKRAVAISSAFPPLFPPILVTGKSLAQGGEEDFPLEADLLSDGGVFDNLGAQRYLLENDRNDEGANIVLLSDAGARFDWRLKRRFRWIFQRAIRATDIMMSRMTDSAVSQLIDVASTKVAICSIDSINDPQQTDVLNISIQKQLPFIRTDLDKFSAIEIDALVSHGYQVARRELTKRGLVAHDSVTTLSGLRSKPLTKLSGEGIQSHVEHLQRSAKRRIGIIELSDLAPSAGILLIFLLVISAFVMPIFQIVKQQITLSEQRSALLEQRKRLEEVEYHCSGTSVFDIREDGSRAIRNRDIQAAKAIATSLRECNEYDAAASNLFGSAAFLSGDYDVAAASFQRAVQLRPLSGVLVNLADSLVELSLTATSPSRQLRLEHAISLYQKASADVDLNEINFKLAKAYLYKNDLDSAEIRIQMVPDKFPRDVGRGKGRILESAILLTKSRRNPFQQSDEAARAAAAFLRGYSQQPEYWADIFIIGNSNAEEPYSEIVRLLNPEARSWLGK